MLLSFNVLILSAKDYKASLFGVKSDGITLNTRSIQTAIDFISSNGGGRLVFYVGRYLTGSIQLKSNVTILLQEGAVLVGTTSVYDYSGINGKMALVSAEGQQNIGITGKGVIEGQGAALQEQVGIQIDKGYLEGPLSKVSPALIAMKECTGIAIEGINLTGACGDVQFYDACKDLIITGLSVKSNSVDNSRGICLSDCAGGKLSSLFFSTSGKELTIDGTSANITVTTCINEQGEKIGGKD